MSQYLTTRELADLLRIGERKAYDLASSGEIPCVRAMGKLLFPKAEIIAWLNASRSGPQVVELPLPPIVAGSHDPLLDWALRESGSGLATYYDGSFDGLNRLSDRTAQAAVLHIHEPEGFNTQSLRDKVGNAPVILYQIAHRQRGLLLAPGASEISGFQDLKARRVILRQDSAASQHLFDAELDKYGFSRGDLNTLPICARTEEELAIALRDGKAEAGFGLGALARPYGLSFVPTHSERLDLAIWRRAYFEPPMQTLIQFLRSERFTERATELGGYDLTHLGQIHHNGASG
ncbi:DNA binding domain-containing protein, excisionase family [Ruegeria halocynthiae]|uniref:DNA binding domain-containing protein, excisionase family n=1 Tax=Ruegeria halocynthiae TaxID=985054 RepID=A0A1H2U6N5_9RHOB|nr:helix-turn-helix transcriptional regulator [Ruegeria halocynthiae]SDW51862.1 DNA binding domain-containing protein, excisionase family [Ruegeria halocynthiae]